MPAGLRCFQTIRVGMALDYPTAQSYPQSSPLCPHFPLDSTHRVS